MKYLSLILISLSLVLVSCGSSKQVMRKLDDTAFIQLETTPCFGRCPTYTMKLMVTGEASFDGKHYTKKAGQFVKQFSEEEVQQLFEQIMALDPMNRPDVYDNEMVTDLPSNILTFFDGKTEKTIRCRFDIPEDMLDFIQKLRAAAESTTGWEAVSSK